MSDTSTTAPPATTDDVAALRADAEAGRIAQREVAFLKAGVDVADPMRAHLMNTYGGENKPEAVQAYLSGLGVTPAAEVVTPPPTNVDDGQQQMREQISGEATGSGASPIPAGNTPPPVQLSARDQAWAEFAGKDPEGVMRNLPLQNRQLAVIDHWLVGAGKGEPGMIFDREEWNATRLAHGHGEDVIKR